MMERVTQKYFDCDNKGNFLYDNELGFDPKKPFDCRRKNGWAYIHSIRPKGEWEQREVSLKKIPPTLFLLAVVNTYSRAFMTFIDADMSLEEFSKQSAQMLRKFFCERDAKHYCSFRDPLYLLNHVPQYTLIFINDNFKVESAKHWNVSYKKAGLLYCFDIEDDEKNIEVHKAIEDIVAYCEEIMEKEINA
jgi:hypothetical protein